jgi:galactose mutarotase-like enzyme
MKIFNDYLEVSFRAKGAEMVSLKKIDTDTEYLWQADPEYWGRYAPVLFPFVGKLKEDTYTYEDQAYTMGQHGFARNMEFNLIDQEKERIRFSFTAIPDTFRNYPFRFELIITYEVDSESLIVTYEVKNLESPDLYFSIGGHPGFNCPLIQGEDRSDYWLEFEKKEDAQTHRIHEGLFTGETEPVFQDNKIRLTKTIFDKDALIFKGLRSNKLSLVSPSRKWLTFHFDGFPYLGIWSKSQNSPFVCIEPWYGIADHQNHNKVLAEKEGINVLHKSETFTCSYRVDIH